MAVSHETDHLRSGILVPSIPHKGTYLNNSGLIVNKWASYHTGDKGLVLTSSGRDGWQEVLEKRPSSSSTVTRRGTQEKEPNGQHKLVSGKLMRQCASMAEFRHVYGVVSEYSRPQGYTSTRCKSIPGEMTQHTNIKSPNYFHAATVASNPAKQTVIVFPGYVSDLLSEGSALDFTPRFVERSSLNHLLLSQSNINPHRTRVTAQYWGVPPHHLQLMDLKLLPVVGAHKYRHEYEKENSSSCLKDHIRPKKAGPSSRVALSGRPLEVLALDLARARNIAVSWRASPGWKSKPR